MGKAIGGLPQAPALRPRDPAAPEPSIGGWLARQRELRGIGLDELARTTRIPRRSLERLEAGAFDGVPDGFARGFVRTVAAAIGVDPEDAVARMLPEARVRSVGAGPGLRRAAAAVLLLAALAAAVWGGVWLVRAVSGVAAAQEPVLRVRRDAVRALAVANGLVPPDEGAPARPLVPVGRPEPAPAAEEPAPAP
jgi:cytoskeleton protein RodZ